MEYHIWWWLANAYSCLSKGFHFFVRWKLGSIGMFAYVNRNWYVKYSDAELGARWSRWHTLLNKSPGLFASFRPKSKVIPQIESKKTGSDNIHSIKFPFCDSFVHICSFCESVGCINANQLDEWKVQHWKCAYQWNVHIVCRPDDKSVFGVCSLYVVERSLSVSFWKITACEWCCCCCRSIELNRTDWSIDR